MGLRLPDLDVLEYGFVLDMMAEQSNDDYKYPVMASQADFDRF